MPSTILGNPLASGPQQLISGNFWSGRNGPVGGIQLVLYPDASGLAYVGFSGGLTQNSGGFFMSGGGLLDGIPIVPGVPYFVPKMAISPSGTCNIYIRCDAACSGQARLGWEAF